MSMRLPLVAFALLAAALGVRSTQGAVLLSDDFDGYAAQAYADGTSFGGWNVNASFAGGGTSVKSVVDGSLQYAGNNYSVGSAGGKKVSIATTNASGSNSSIFDHSFASQSDELWLSFTFQTSDSAAGANLAPMVFFSNAQFSNIGTEGFYGFGSSGTNLGMRRGTAGFVTANALAANTTYFVVARMFKTPTSAGPDMTMAGMTNSANTYNNGEMWINPVLGAGGSLPAASLSQNFQDGTNTFFASTAASYLSLRYFQQGGVEGRTMMLDNVKVGTAYGDVNPVPEPAAWLSIVAGLAALPGLRRGRR